MYLANSTTVETRANEDVKSSLCKTPVSTQCRDMTNL